MMKLNIQLFGGRGARSSKNDNIARIIVKLENAKKGDEVSRYLKENKLWLEYDKKSETDKEGITREKQLNTIGLYKGTYTKPERINTILYKNGKFSLKKK